MDYGHVLSRARHRASLTQRELAKRAKVAQPVIARIETSRAVPRVDTMDRLLTACGETLEALPRLGVGVDRTLIHEMLRMTPEDRITAAAAASRGLAEIRRGLRR
jgi:predicted transcriptional regulator